MSLGDTIQSATNIELVKLKALHDDINMKGSIEQRLIRSALVSPR